MISDLTPSEEAYVWIWLPEATEPVFAGRVYRDGEDLLFNYGEISAVERSRFWGRVFLNPFAFRDAQARGSVSVCSLDFCR